MSHSHHTTQSQMVKLNLQLKQSNSCSRKQRTRWKRSLASSIRLQEHSYWRNQRKSCSKADVTSNTDAPTHSVKSSTPRSMYAIYKEVSVEKSKRQVLPWPSCEAATWTGDWSRSQNSTHAEEPTVEGSYMYWETIRQVLCSQIRQWVLQKKQAVSETCSRTFTNRKAEYQGWFTGAKRNSQKYNPKVPRSPSKPASPKQGSDPSKKLLPQKTGSSVVAPKDKNAEYSSVFKV